MVALFCQHFSVFCAGIEAKNRQYGPETQFFSVFFIATCATLFQRHRGRCFEFWASKRKPAKGLTYVNPG